MRYPHRPRAASSHAHSPIPRDPMQAEWDRKVEEHYQWALDELQLEAEEKEREERELEEEERRLEAEALAEEERKRREQEEEERRLRTPSPTPKELEVKAYMAYKAMARYYGRLYNFPPKPPTPSPCPTPSSPIPLAAIGEKSEKERAIVSRAHTTFITIDKVFA